MHFYDEAHISVKAGRGGDGAIAWHKDKYVPKGGPAGGDGGNGGHVVLKTNVNMTTLQRYISQPDFAAEDGGKGGVNDRFGFQGEDLILEVPVGTLVYKEGSDELIADLKNPGDSIQVARGGVGGLGNAKFATAVRQAPHFAELGEPGETIDLHLELKLIADVGIIGIPSAGKSTLISVISNAKPKIADYPFTTLVPNLGVIEHRGKSFVVSDVPGLIEGAHAGKGLGDAFLKHIERTAIIVHMLDITSSDPAKDYKMINNELANYSELVALKQQIVVLNKVDIIDEDTRNEFIKDIAKQIGLKPSQILPISAAAHINLDKLLDQIASVVEAGREMAQLEEVANSKKPKVYKPAARKDKRILTITEERGGFRVSSGRLEQLAIMTDKNNEEAMARLYDVLKKRGVLSRLEKRGIVEGQPIYVGKQVLEFFV